MGLGDGADLADHLKEDGVLDAGDVGHLLVVAYSHWEAIMGTKNA